MIIDLIVKGEKFNKLLYCKKSHIFFIKSEFGSVATLTFKALKEICDINNTEVKEICR